MKETVVPMMYRPLLWPVEFTYPFAGVGFVQVTEILIVFIKIFKVGFRFKNWEIPNHYVLL